MQTGIRRPSGSAYVTCSLQSAGKANDHPLYDTSVLKSCAICDARTHARPVYTFALPLLSDFLSFSLSPCAITYLTRYTAACTDGRHRVTLFGVRGCTPNMLAALDDRARGQPSCCAISLPRAGLARRW